MESAPFVVRLIEGDITRARASMLVVNHFNEVSPVGSEAAMDRALDGAISRRSGSGALAGKFGSTNFIPATTSGVPATCVLVLGLGEPEKFTIDRIPELGAAIVDSAATLGLRDVATILHGAGSGKADPEEAATLLLEGVLSALGTVTGADCLKEFSIVEYNPDRLDVIEKGLRAARAGANIHVYFERGKTSALKLEGPDELQRVVPEHLRLGITRAGQELKVTVIGNGAFDVSCEVEYPTDVAGNLPKRLRDQILNEPDPKARERAMVAIGSQLYKAFLSFSGVPPTDLLEKSVDRLVVLRLDDSTVDLPWELLYFDKTFLSREYLLARQLEIGVPGRQSSYPPPSDEVRVLIIGDPTDNLPGAKAEAEALARRFDKGGAKVKALIGGVTYKDVSRELDQEPYDILHYAGHAKFDELDEGASGLELADHLLTVDDLSSRHFLPRLFFANACNSAQTGGDLPDPLEAKRPTLNMVSGLLAAGARAFVGSMWQVDDKAAVTFAAAFYDSLLGGPKGGGKRSSFGEAVLKGREAIVKAHGEGEHAWAGYALYGSPWKGIL